MRCDGGNVSETITLFTCVYIGCDKACHDQAMNGAQERWLEIDQNKTRWFGYSSS
jgi:hypothetical protein